jgi:hypothetical protein
MGGVTVLIMQEYLLLPALFSHTLSHSIDHRHTDLFSETIESELKNLITGNSQPM